MNKSSLAIAAAVMGLALSAPGRAAVVVSVVQGMVQSVSAGARTGSIIISGKTYAVPAGAAIVGAPQLSGVPLGARVTVILTPDGKQVMRLIVQPPGLPASEPQHLR
ncbi:MAG: hypothetical protein KGI40_08015 [Xanthomonadaceae bacterium]|nr:hypothetical protein [Xanthomonadaceae bacterium]MDE1959016.1 hypothetical protein [Xanthomonadaceae bacterium]MDE2177502.1 hypothetical protein [Xanthomonadaceae bacterium]MDE2244637.1 hypothetical protein [Xanthomonadaceae bacterium]